MTKLLLCLGLVNIRAFASISPAPLQYTFAHGTSIQKLSKAFDKPNAAHDLLLVAADINQVNSTLTISDVLNNSYELVLGPLQSSAGYAFYLWQCKDAKPGTNIVSINSTGASGTIELRLSEWSGADNIKPLDKVASAFGNSGSPSAGPVTTTANGELVYAYAGSATSAGAGAGFSPLSLDFGDLDEYMIQNVAGPVSAVFTQAPGDWVVIMATFCPVGGCGAPPPPPPGVTTWKTRVGDVIPGGTDYDTSMVLENQNLYYTALRARAAISVLPPLVYNPATGVISCPACLFLDAGGNLTIPGALTTGGPGKLQVPVIHSTSGFVAVCVDSLGNFVAKAGGCVGN